MTDFSKQFNKSQRNRFVERSLIRAMSEYLVPGVSVAIIHDYSVAWSQTYGVLQAGQAEPTRADTLFQACSISKAVTAVASLRLVQAGSLDLDTDVNRFLTTWKIPANDAWQPIVTLRQLLSHTAGTNVPWFYGYHRDQDIPSLAQILAGEKPANTPGVRVTLFPGTRFRYSGGAYCILQQLLCDLRQQPFPELMRDLVLDPLGMEYSTFEQPLPEKYWNHTSSGHRADGKSLAGGWHTMPEMAAAGLWTTATDLARFSTDLQLALAGKSDQLLSPEMVRILISPEVPHDISGFMGLGVWLEGLGQHARFGHPGDNEGFACRWTASQAGGIGAVIMTNSDRGGELIADVLHDIAQAYDWPEVDGPPPSPRMRTAMMQYVGTYRFASGTTCKIMVIDNNLYLQMLPQQPALLLPVSETIYVLQPLEAEVIFLTDGAGMVHGLLLRQEGTDFAATKIIPD